ncbi:hypothetical protein BN1232_02212 [Mycobacterium lentiflavum]|uniref:Uncharacterized protein n=1 Tax=Mycobacterium lentiflavum TaxID=141349 RepID=A0A0E4CMS9_MYCLN|nr:hypothetical protein [Mycobacterium lentiflavum]CQD11776.1 hypothetical protein BN1232_02212 [Mycobacterium lentiflavum]
MISTDQTVEQVCQSILSIATNPKDKVLVAQVTRDAIWTASLPQEVSDWLQRYLED